ncbi:MAG TPA: hypothetical protein VFJ16_09425 [Longimicrobium sp.]|nr:hypothetical protein [Longimicrobium sp.]
MRRDAARPLKRSIQRLVQNPLAIRVLEGEFEDGDTIVVDREPGASVLTFRPAGAPTPADAASDAPERETAGGGDGRGRLGARRELRQQREPLPCRKARERLFARRDKAPRQARWPVTP